jgi:hypothetical protein
MSDVAPMTGWGPAPCWGCGSVGEHPTLGGHYWPCGTMKSSSIRGEQCYEAEIAILKERLRLAHKKKGGR